VSAAIKLVRRVRETGSTEPAKIGGYRKPMLAGHEEVLRELTAARKGITLAESRWPRSGTRWSRAGSSPVRSRQSGRRYAVLA
jgi:NOL1/NOP2/fmu family ribosome biogenesis protein